GGTQGSKTLPTISTAPDKGWCSTWGAGHFSTFDGHVYDFLGTCNYVFAATCEDMSPTFSVQLRRGPSGNISRIIVELGTSAVTVQKAVISVKDVGVVSLPYSSTGLQITPFGRSVQLVAKQLELELVVMWGPGSHLLVLVEKRHMGKLCGLCGDFNGKRTDEFLSEEGKPLEPHTYAALQRLDDPNEICTSTPVPRPQAPQAEHVRQAAGAPERLSPGEGRPCSRAEMGGPGRRLGTVARGREAQGPGLVGEHRATGPGNLCPTGMVLDDVSKNHTCVPVAQCPCMLHGMAHAPGEVVTDACRTCRCSLGHWVCTERPCPGRCSLEGSSFVTTFDARPYRFHGACTYILLQSPQLPDGGSLVASYDKSGYSHSETALAAVIYMSGEDKIVISRDEVLTNSGNTKWLPYKTRNITVFRQTSTHLQMTTTFGLELVVQLEPVFQAYVTVGPQFRGQTRGLCGTFNGDTTDDFMTSTGIVEGTAPLFVDSWRTGNCPASLEREIDPCSMSQLNKVCAETHCSVLVRDGTVFQSCHATVNPRPFYKRCVYQACNYEETLPHVCAALSDYARACATHGRLLRGWRDSVNCTTPCTGNQTFGDNIRACGRTCLSLSDHTAECHPSAVPMDGCACPEGTYLNHKAQCVRKAQCPCLLDGSKLIPADESTMVNGAICYCVNGRLSCPGRPQLLLATCSAPKTFQSCDESSERTFGAACAPTCQRLATGTPCVPTKCEPGCVCAQGLYENATGHCVPLGRAPQPPEPHVPASGCPQITRPQGRQPCLLGLDSCAKKPHPQPLVHFPPFSGTFCQPQCLEDRPPAESRPGQAWPTRSLTDGVPLPQRTCAGDAKPGGQGVSVVLADRNCTVHGEDPHVRLQVATSPLNLVLDVVVGSSYNLTLIWNKRMTVSISVTRGSQGALCGLCGNYNGNMKDDFETRSNYVASSELEFVNSWKDSPLCGDAGLALDPCSLNAFRRSWATRKCGIINSPTFAACHSQVYHLPYYEACVRDACGCDTSGDCECLCDAVAAYAKACLDKGVCVDWRTPDFCPVYCDFYNTHAPGDGGYQYDQEADCTWHYQPCLCPGYPQSVPDTNTEGTGQAGSPCAQPHTSPQTERAMSSLVPQSPRASSPREPLGAHPVPPSRTPSSSPETIGEQAIYSITNESPRTIPAITLRPTSEPAPTVTLKSTATGPMVTGATTKSTASTLSSVTRSTAQSTEHST
uniref:VWFD domain-containing protein n=1 Tax=Mustela putorius furo TaxID=9669 RepID=M3XP80_MUSPF